MAIMDNKGYIKQVINGLLGLPMAQYIASEKTINFYLFT